MILLLHTIGHPTLNRVLRIGRGTSRRSASLRPSSAGVEYS